MTDMQEKDFRMWVHIVFRCWC